MMVTTSAHGWWAAPDARCHKAVNRSAAPVPRVSRFTQ